MHETPLRGDRGSADFQPLCEYAVNCHLDDGYTAMALLCTWGADLTSLDCAATVVQIYSFIKWSCLNVNNGIHADRPQHMPQNHYQLYGMTNCCDLYRSAFNVGRILYWSRPSEFRKRPFAQSNNYNFNIVVLYGSTLEYYRNCLLFLKGSPFFGLINKTTNIKSTTVVYEWLDC